MLNWFRNNRREEILDSLFPGEWEKLIQKNVPYYQYLTHEEKKGLQDLVQVFIAEKHWEGCNGLELTDEIRVVIAAHACLLILELPSDCYSRVESIYVYPTTVFTPEHKTSFFEVHTAPVDGPMAIDGEAHHRGPVILVWDAVKHESRHPEHGHNVVYHEFAHKLDMLDGKADGTPPLTTKEEYQRWIDVCSQEYLELSNKVEEGDPVFIDDYAATNEAEFFAVVTEHFFCQPEQLKNHHPKLYQVLKEFYRHDPALKVLNSQQAK
jgi:Mlc titration factor MtfA (ptsG expression regulator)